MSEIGDNGQIGEQDALGPSVRDFVLLACGFGCLIGFARVCSLGYWGYLAFGQLSSFDEWYILRLTVELETLALLALAGWTSRFSVNLKVLACAGAGAVASALIFAFGGSGPLGALVAVLGGASMAVLLFVWMLLLARFPRRMVIAAVVAGLVLAGAIVEGSPYLGYGLALAVVVAAALVASLSAVLLDPGLRSCASDGPLTGAAAARVPWLTVVMFVGCGFFASVLYGVSGHLTWLYDWKPNSLVFECAVVVGIVSTVAVMLRSRAWMHVIWAPLFALVVCAVACSCLPSRPFVEAAIGFMMASMFCANFLVWIVFPALFSSLEVPRAFPTAVLLMLCNTAVGTLAGDALGAALPRSMQNLGSVAGLLAIVLAVALAITVVMNRRRSGTVGVWGAVNPVAAEPVVRAEAPSDSGEAEGSESPVDALRAKLDVLVGQYGLTPRESEVALYTVQGFSCAYIADKLVVSNSTVRFHQQNIYRKFEVHSRNELIETVNGEEG